MSTTTGFDLTQLSEHINETELGLRFWSEAVMSNDSFAFVRQFGTVYEGLKNDTFKLPTLETTATLKDGSDCSFSPTDQTTFDQTELHMVPVTIQGQFCVKELEPYFFGQTLPGGQHYTGFQPIEQAIIARLKEEIAKKMAIFPYYGPTGSDTVTYAYPWIDQLEDATGIVEDTTPETITAGGSAGTDTAGAFNIVERLADLFYSNIDTAGAANNGDYVVSMSPTVMRLYFKNYRTLFGANNVAPVMQQLATGNYSSWQHDGSNLTIVSQNALGLENQIIVQRKKNQVLGFDAASDTTRIEMGMDQYRKNIWWDASFKIGTAFRSLNANSVRYYGTAS